MDNVDLVTYDRDLEDNYILVMCSDGIMDANREEKEQEKYAINGMKQDFSEWFEWDIKNNNLVL